MFKKALGFAQQVDQVGLGTERHTSVLLDTRLPEQWGAKMIAFQRKGKKTSSDARWQSDSGYHALEGRAPFSLIVELQAA